MARLRLWAGILRAAASSRSTRQFYDRISAVYDDVFVAHRVHADAIMRLLREFDADRRRDGAVMDLGCGTGMLTTMLADRFRAVVGVDLSLLSLRVLARRCRSCRLVQADANALPLMGGSFQAVVCLGVWRHLPDIPRALDEVSRVLTRDGTFVVGYFPPALAGAIPVPEGPVGRLLARLYEGITSRLGYVDRVGASLERDTVQEARTRFAEVSTVTSGPRARLVVARYPVMPGVRDAPGAAVERPRARGTLS